MPTNPPPRFRDLQRQIAALGPIFTGTITRRMKLCGKPRCACHTDPDARHGPYLEWSRREGGRFVSTSVTPESAETLVRGITEHRKLDDLIAAWEQASLATLPVSTATARAKSPPARKRNPRSISMSPPRPPRTKGATSR